MTIIKNFASTLPLHTNYPATLQYRDEWENVWVVRWASGSSGQKTINESEKLHQKAKIK